MIELEGRPVARALSDATATRARVLAARGHVPQLLVIRVGADPADAAYLRGIERASETCGVATEIATLEADTPQRALVRLLEDASADDAIHGILLMRPLPAGFDEGLCAAAIAPAKDVDGMTAQSLADVFAGQPGALAPATARAVIELLDHYGYDVAGRDVCVVGRSRVVGRPLQALLCDRDATVTLCHSRTVDLAGHLRRAELVVSCVGRAGFVTPSMVAPDAWVVDVGINVTEAGSVVGDVDPAVAEVAGALSPVPGGVGAITSAVLMAQTVEAAWRQVPR